MGYVLLSLVTYFVSSELLHLYTEGDQAHYRTFYEALAGVQLADIAPMQLLSTGSAEPLYGYLMWLGANAGLEKTAYVSFFNIVLIVLLVRFLRVHQAPLFVVLLFLANFYLLVLMTSAERLKFSVLLLLAFAVMSGRLRYLFAAAAPLAHFQTAIFYAAMLAGKFYEILMHRGRIKAFAIMVGAILIGTLVIDRYGSMLVSKLSAHKGSFGIAELIPTAVLTFAGLVILRWQRARFLLSMVPIAGATMLLGGSRVNMVGFMVLTYMTVVGRRTNHPIYLILLVYFAYKSIDYVFAIIQTGSGFPEVLGN